MAACNGERGRDRDRLMAGESDVSNVLLEGRVY